MDGVMSGKGMLSFVDIGKYAVKRHPLCWTGFAPGQSMMSWNLLPRRGDMRNDMESLVVFMTIMVYGSPCTAPSLSYLCRSPHMPLLLLRWKS